MKRLLILLTIFSFSLIALAQSTSKTNKNTIPPEKKAMKIGIVIYSNDAETVWNAFRFANFSLAEWDSVSIFLLGKGVEAQTASTNDFDIKSQMEDFSSTGGSIYACGTCLRSRNQEGSKLCPVSNLSKLGSSQ